MREILAPVFAAGLLVFTATAARSQVAPVEGEILNEAPIVTPALPPSIYATTMLRPSPSYPWVMVPRFRTAATPAAGLGWGNPFSPYGLYSRYPYYATGPYPAVTRPYFRFENDHGHEGRSHGH